MFSRTSTLCLGAALLLLMQSVISSSLGKPPELPIPEKVNCRESGPASLPYDAGQVPAGAIEMEEATAETSPTCEESCESEAIETVTPWLTELLCRCEGSLKACWRLGFPAWGATTPKNDAPGSLIRIRRLVPPTCVTSSGNHGCSTGASSACQKACSGAASAASHACADHCQKCCSGSAKSCCEACAACAVACRNCCMKAATAGCAACCAANQTSNACHEGAVHGCCSACPTSNEKHSTGDAATAPRNAPKIANGTVRVKRVRYLHAENGKVIVQIEMDVPAPSKARQTAICEAGAEACECPDCDGGAECCNLAKCRTCPLMKATKDCTSCLSEALRICHKDFLDCLAKTLHSEPSSRPTPVSASPYPYTCPYLKQQDAQKSDPHTVTCMPGNALETLKKLQAAEQSYLKAEHCRLDGQTDRACKLYEKVQTLCPGSRFERMATAHLQLISAINEAHANSHGEEQEATTNNARRNLLKVDVLLDTCQGAKSAGNYELVKKLAYQVLAQDCQNALASRWLEEAEHHLEHRDTPHSRLGTPPECTCPYMKSKMIEACRDRAVPSPETVGILENLNKLVQARKILDAAERCRSRGQSEQACELYESLRKLCPGSRYDRLATQELESVHAAMIAPNHEASEAEEQETTETNEATNPGHSMFEGRLNSPINVDLKNVTLKKILERLGETSGVTIVPDMEALQDEGISLETPCRISVHMTNVSLKSALKMLLASTGLEVTVADETVRIVPRGHNVMVSECCQLTDAARHYLDMGPSGHTHWNALKDRITSTIAPKSWDSAGGRGCFVYTPKEGKLFIQQSPGVMRKVNDFLAKELWNKVNHGTAEEAEDGSPTTDDGKQSRSENTTEDHVARLLEACQRCLTQGQFQAAQALAAQALALDAHCVAAHALVYRTHLLVQLEERRKAATISQPVGEVRSITSVHTVIRQGNMLQPKMPVVDPRNVDVLESARQNRAEPAPAVPLEDRTIENDVPDSRQPAEPQDAEPPSLYFQPPRSDAPNPDASLRGSPGERDSSGSAWFGKVADAVRPAACIDVDTTSTDGWRARCEFHVGGRLCRLEASEKGRWLWVVKRLVTDE